MNLGGSAATDCDTREHDERDGEKERAGANAALCEKERRWNRII